MTTKIGNIFYGTEGVAVLNDWGTGFAMDLAGKVVTHFNQGKQGFTAGAEHVQNFVDAVKSRNPGDLHAEIREGHLSAGFGHTATLSYRLGKPASIDLVRKTIEGFGGADRNVETLERTLAHLAADGVDPKTTPLTLGAVLKMDTKTETFINNPAANAMLTRKYRKNFEVPSAGKV